ncbi:MAG TPA: VOC family protein [Phycisphaerales bacterium]|nr:VOC family protein [Phycisphaerales bacterium]
MPSASKHSAVITNLRPMLAVRDLAATVRFYVEKLGFNCCSMFGNPPVWAELERNGTAIMFNAPPRESVERDVPRPSKNYQIFYFNVDDLPALHAELSARGVAVSPMRVTVYGMKEFEVRDPDDYWLWFGEPTDEPPTVTE